MTRTVVVWCPDWPLVAAGLAAVPAAVVKQNRVVASSPPARAEGVRRRQRRREAEAACPGLQVVGESPAAEVRSFEGVVAAVTAFTPRVEVTRPGLCSFPARGPARYFGGEERLAGLLVAAADEAVAALGGPGAPGARVGIADSHFAARLAARVPAVVPPGGTAAFLAPFPVAALGAGPLAELLARLGIRRVGQLAEMDEGVVSARFGREGMRAHRLARGLDDRPLAPGEPPISLTVERSLDDPVERVETVAFLASGLAESLAARLGGRGLACTRLLVEASTEHGEEIARWWRADRPLRARAMVDRVRWQLEGWMTAPTGAPTGGITLIRLTADEVAPDLGRQGGFLGEPAEVTHRVERAAARIQGLLGPDAVGTAVPDGGRGPGEQLRIVSFGEPRTAAPAAAAPWPGRLPPPSPPVVYAAPLPASLRGASGTPVEVSGRGRLSAPPASLFLPPGRSLAVTGWAGPWPSDERWWDPDRHRRRARVQVLLEDGSAHLLVLEGGSWAVEASYD